jgi:hypothetical protein
MERSRFIINFFIRFHIFSRDLKSRFEVGSSRMRSLPSPMIDIAIESFLRPPGER